MRKTREVSGRGCSPREAGGWGKAWVILTPDGAHGDKVFATSYESAIRQAGFDVFVIPNQGQGAASAHIETARRLFLRVFFNKDTTEEGREALGLVSRKEVVGS